MSFLLAQVSDAPGWIAGATAVASLGIASWFLYYTVAVRQPREDAAKALAEKENRAHIEGLMKGFNDAIREIRLECKQEKDALLKEIAEEREAREVIETARHNDNNQLLGAINRLSEMVQNLGRNSGSRRSQE